MYEPEVHLHPEWQIEFARIVCELIKNDMMNILITSHSPYLIQAMKKFSMQSKIEKKANFYFAYNNDDHTSTIDAVTNDLNRLLTSLSEPFQKLVWGE